MTWTRTVRRRLWLPPLALAIFVAALVAPAAASAAAWVGTQTLTENPLAPSAAPTPQIATDAAGDAVMVLKGGKGNGQTQTIQVATRPAGGSWSAFTELGTTTNGFTAPALAVDPSGDAVVAFAETTTQTLSVFYKAAGSSTFALEKQVTPTSSPLEVAAAMDPSGSGNATVVWRRTPTPASSTVEAIQRTAGTWGVTQTALSTSETYAQVHVADDGSGVPVVVVATDSPFGCAGVGCTSFALRSAAFNGAWNANTVEPSNATDRYDLSGKDIGLTRDASGQVQAIYVRSSNTATMSVIRSATLGVGSTNWTSPATVYTPAAGSSPQQPSISVDAGGSATASWLLADPASGINAIMATTGGGGSFASPTTLASGNPTPAVQTIDGAGNVSIAWSDLNTNTIRFATRPAGGAIGGPSDAAASTAGVTPSLAADSAGDVSLAYVAGATTVTSGVYDNAGPSLAALPPDPQPRVGDLVSFSTSPSDIWSNPVSVHWDFGDGGAADGNSATHVYSTPGVYRARATATDSSGNATSQTQTVTVTAVPGLSRPIAGKTANLQPISGTVLVKLPGAATYVPLVSPTQVRVGSIIDARHGRVRITIDNGRGGLDTADFYGGIFEFTQPKVKAGRTWFADLYLFGGSFRGCPAAPTHPRIASVSKKLSPTRSVRKLWASGHGAFRTVGRFSSATIRGTTWLTDDRCDGTLTKVTAGKVAVRDFVKNKTVIVRARHRYLARAKR
jgi:hypothetical protein